MQASDRDGAEDARARAELRAELDTALDRLPARYRVPLILHYLEGREQADVAAALSISVNTCTSLLSRARTRLRECLQGRSVIVPAALLAGFLSEQASADEGALVAKLSACATTKPVGAVAALAAEQIRHATATALIPAKLITAASVVLAVFAGWHWSETAATPSPAPNAVVTPATIPVSATPLQQIAPVSPDLSEAAGKAFAAFPPAVQFAVADAAAGRSIIECEAETENGKMVYSAEVVESQDVVIEYSFDENGVLIEQETERVDTHDDQPPPATGADSF